MDKGTLLTNGNSYSGDGGTLIVNGISYSGGVVESGGIDVSDTTADAMDVLYGRYFYNSNGVKTLGQYHPPVVPELQSIDVRVNSLWDSFKHAGQWQGWDTVYYGLAEEEKAKILPENIKAGVTILGVQGGYVGLNDFFASGRSITSTTESIEVFCGFKPSYIAITQGTSFTADANAMRIYDARRNSAKQYINGSVYDFPTTTANRIGNVTETGFTLTKTSNQGYVSWFAVY